MKQYLDIVKDILVQGEDREGRNGLTRSLFAHQFRHNMQEGFPIITTRKIPFRSVVGELLWFLSGSTDNRDLKRIMGRDKTIWSENAAKWGNEELGPIYGHQWRHFNGDFEIHDDKKHYVYEGVDQITQLVNRIIRDPYSRYHVVTAWSPSDFPFMALPACHMGFQVYCFKDRISLHMVQRSCDMMLGVPFNISSYGLFLCMLGQVTDRIPHELVITFNDAHIYANHTMLAGIQLAREPLPLPTLCFNPEIKNIFGFSIDDIGLANYRTHDPINYPMSV